MDSRIGAWMLPGFFFGFFLIAQSISRYSRKNKFVVRGKTILLTGASQGMGLSVAKQLSQKGANLIIVARNTEKLEQALEEIKLAAIESSQWFQTISADVSKPGEALKIVSKAITLSNGELPDIVWCIAGSAYPGLFIDIPQSIMRDQMDTNYWSCVDMAHAILQRWLASGILIGYAPYASSKAAIKSLSDTLAQEVVLYGDEVKIHTVFPGTIQSPGYEKENLLKPEITHILEAADPIQSPDVAAAKAISGLEKGEYLVTLGLLGDAMRGCAWGGSHKNNWVIDTAVTWITSLAWPFVIFDFNRQIKAYRRKNGHPSTYSKVM